MIIIYINSDDNNRSNHTNTDNHNYCIKKKKTLMIVMIKMIQITIRVISTTVTRMIIIDILQSYGLKVF